MEQIVIVASKTCSHYPLLEQELRKLGVACEVRFVEENPDLIEEYGLDQSPNLVVGDMVVFRGQASHPLPSPSELEGILKDAGAFVELKAPRAESGTFRRQGMSTPMKRAEKRTTPRVIPQPVPGESGLVQVDVTWGTLQPMRAAEGVRTVGETEVLQHLERGLTVVDSRKGDAYGHSTIPGAVNVPFPEAAARAGELDQEHPTIFFCNGPQCGQSPAAIRTLLEAGHPAERILYYRGGLHDWITLGLPVTPGSVSPAQPAS